MCRQRKPITLYSGFLAYYAAIPVRPYYSHYYASILAPCLLMTKVWKFGLEIVQSLENLRTKFIEARNYFYMGLSIDTCLLLFLLLLLLLFLLLLFLLLFLLLIFIFVVVIFVVVIIFVVVCCYFLLLFFH